MHYYVGVGYTLASTPICQHQWAFTAVNIQFALHCPVYNNKGQAHHFWTKRGKFTLLLLHCQFCTSKPDSLNEVGFTTEGPVCINNAAFAVLLVSYTKCLCFITILHVICENKMISSITIFLFISCLVSADLLWILKYSRTSISGHPVGPKKGGRRAYWPDCRGRFMWKVRWPGGKNS